MQVQVLSLGLVIEPLRVLSAWLIRHGSKYIARPGQWPPLCSLATQRFSPVYIVLAYFSSILCGVAARLTLIISICGSADLAAWSSSFGEEAARLRRSVRSSSAWTWFRHRDYQKYPWRFAAIGDSRLPQDEKMEIWRIFYDMRACCTHFGFCQRLRELYPEWHSLSFIICERLFYRWACAARISIVDIECRHARNHRQKTSNQMSWLQHCACYISREIKHLSTRAAQAMRALWAAMCPESSAASGAQSLTRAKRRSRKAQETREEY